MGFFRRNKRQPAEHADLGPMDDRQVYAQVWERKRMPDEGAQSYAYESLDLPQFTYIGPAISVRMPDPVPVTCRPIYAYQAGQIIGIPLIAGQYYTTPLVDQNGDPVGADLGTASDVYIAQSVGAPDPVAWNVPNIPQGPGVFGMAVANQPFPLKSR